MRILYPVLAASAAMAFMVGALAQTPQLQPLGAENLPDKPGKDRVVLACGNCHQPDIVVGQQHDLAGWREIVDQMVARGASVDEADYAVITTYLAENMGS